MSEIAQDLTDIDFTDPGLYEKIRKEMGLNKQGITANGGIEHLISLMGFDLESIQHWQNIGIKDVVESELPPQWSVSWKTPTAETQGYPFGLEIKIPNLDLKKTLLQHGRTIWGIMSAIEQGLINGYEGKDFNFTVVFTTGEQGAKITVCPHDWVRAGVMESMGIILHRT